MQSKVCFKCHQNKPLSEFYKHKQMGDGHLNKCKTCTRKDATKHRWDNLEKIRCYDNERSKLPHRIKMRTTNSEKWRKKFPIKKAAHTILYRAIKDNIVQKPLICEFCNQEKRLEAHHPDYYKPLAVQWLCISCHRCLHRDFNQLGAEYPA